MEAVQNDPTAGNAGVGEVSIGNPSEQSQAAASGTATVAKPEVAVADAKPTPVNLDELPEFRKYKSKIDKERERERKATEARLAQLELEAKQYRSLAERNLSPAELRAVQEQDYRSELERERTTRKELEMMIARQSALSELSTKYGVAIEELEDVESPVEAYERILDKKNREYSDMNARMAKLEQDMQARMAATSAVPVIGGDTSGAGAGGGSLQKQYDDAAMKRDTKEMEKVIALATREGVKLDKLSVFSRKRS
jgi:DNA repair exonuclease SbcCD ATPase subunit